MMKVKFTQAERAGFIFLFCVLILSILFRAIFFRNFYSKSNDSTVYKCSEVLKLKEAQVIENVNQFYRDDYRDFKKSIKSEFNNPEYERKTESRTYKSTFETTSKPVKISLNDIHIDSIKQIIRLPHYLLDRIIKYRDMLGGFYSSDQLYEVYGIDSSQVQYVMKCCFIDQTKIKKISINGLHKNKKYHPYLNNHEIKSIHSLLRFQGEIQDINQLVEERIIDSAKMTLLLPYLSFTD